MPRTTSFNDDSWELHGKTKCAMKTSEIRRNYQEWTSSLRREDWDGWGIYCPWKTTGYQSKPYDGKCGPMCLRHGLNSGLRSIKHNPLRRFALYKFTKNVYKKPAAINQ